MECLSIMLSEGDTWLKGLAEVLGETAAGDRVHATLLPSSLPQTLGNTGNGDASDFSRDKAFVSGKSASGRQAAVRAGSSMKVISAGGKSPVSRTSGGGSRRKSVRYGTNSADSDGMAESSPQLESAMEHGASSKAGEPRTKEGSLNNKAHKDGAIDRRGSEVDPPGEAVVTASEESASRPEVRVDCGCVLFVKIGRRFLSTK